ncbi:hypothetical protein SISSUDRAFT_1047403 [Sistotremastrum suecicum HHB10207 ss-3]|uniref:RING-type domain-containing protein n=1 Tax=Sistotremastrum suecicum HHB10207 ss-3 TaxID=1314776 RepID=A0A166D654_9AGAM|nr:hypothetical protein SISSUDRAFT_1047403 [Sistotremastrum suecicum HHB10207 ss-3]
MASLQEQGTTLEPEEAVAPNWSQMGCSICLEPFVDVGHSLPCGHMYHLHCLERVQESVPSYRGSANCPTCREPFPIGMPEEEDIPALLRPWITQPIRKIFLRPSADEDLCDKLDKLSKNVVELERHRERLGKRCQELHEQLSRKGAENLRLQEAAARHRREQRENLVVRAKMSQDNSELIRRQSSVSRKHKDHHDKKPRITSLKKVVFTYNPMGMASDSTLVSPSTAAGCKESQSVDESEDYEME